MYSPFRYSFTDPDEDQYPSTPYSNIDFSASGNNQPSYGQSPVQAPQPKKSFQDFYNQVSEQAQPKQALYEKFLNQGYPQETPPSKMTRLSAVLAGATTGFARPGEGGKAATEVLNRPYERAVRQYNMEGQRLKEGATVEQNTLSNRAKLATDLSNANDKDVKLGLDQNADDRAERLAKSKIGSAKLTDQKTLIDLAAAGKHIINGEDGNTYIANLADGTITKVGKTGESPDEKSTRDINTEVEKQKRVLPLRYGFETGLQNSRFGNEKSLQDARFAEEDKNLGIRQGGADRRSAAAHANQSQTQIDRKNTDAVQAIIDSDPDNYSGFVAKDSNGVINLKAPDKGATLANKDEWQKYVRVYNAAHPDKPMDPNQFEDGYTTPDGAVVKRKKK